MQPATAKFGSLELVTSPSVMTPRETSTGLVACVADHLEDRPGVVVDVGTGSGAIALAVAQAAPHAAVWATDVSSAAVELARLNARRAGLEDRVTVRHGNLLDPFPGAADVIVANLPYLPITERRRYPELDREPVNAVFADGDGLGLVRRLVAAARRRLAPDGLLALQVRGRIHSARRPELQALEHLLAYPAAIAA
ncbi:MAG: HemK family protein methyltransferase [Actinobacteria bacterium]|nr:MAG: HemK family protein methyltransferase [Actinomycetota bacterium]